MADETDSGAIPTLEDWQHWTWVMGRAQQMLMEAWAESLKTPQPWPTSAMRRSSTRISRR
jgi:polyhydroxyalkanoate synthase